MWYQNITEWRECTSILFIQKVISSIIQEITDKMAEVLWRPCALQYNLLTTF
jgi:hypothetical protein